MLSMRGNSKEGIVKSSDCSYKNIWKSKNKSYCTNILDNCNFCHRQLFILEIMSASKSLSYYFVSKYEERNMGEWFRLFGGTLYAGFLLRQKYEQNLSPIVIVWKFFVVLKSREHLSLHTNL
jgi:hypothetical protein